MWEEEHGTDLCLFVVIKLNDSEKFVDIKIVVSIHLSSALCHCFLNVKGGNSDVRKDGEEIVNLGLIRYFSW